MQETEFTQPTPYPSPLSFSQAPVEHGASGVSWAAIIAGAVAAAALSTILVILGVGLGFSAISPWASIGASATAITISTALWLALTQIVASGTGGYLAGRLRTKWTDIHTDEVYFRDTAHGMLSWAVATLVTAAFLGSVIGGIISTGAQAAGSVASSVAPMVQSAASSVSKGGDGESISYLVDSLLRSDKNPGDNSAQTKTEVATILLHSLSTGTLAANDKTYLGKVVSQHAGLDQADAEKRVGDLYAQAQQKIQEAKTKAKEAADAARKVAAATALWTFVALLCGAFFASLAAIWGGRRRDLAVLETSRDRVA